MGMLAEMWVMWESSFFDILSMRSIRETSGQQHDNNSHELYASFMTRNGVLLQMLSPSQSSLQSWSQNLDNRNRKGDRMMLIIK